MAYTPQIYYPQSSYAPQPFQQLPPLPNNQTQSIIWVSGEVGAKSYIMSPNSTVLLMDSEGDRFYLKQTDGAGMPTLKTYEYKEVLPKLVETSQSEQKATAEQFVTREEYERLRAIVEDLQRPKTAKKKETVENE